MAQQRDRQKRCLEVIKKHFDDDSLYQFLQQKYAGHNSSGNWWKEVGLGILHIINAAGTNQKPGTDLVKKVFSDAIFQVDARFDKNLGLVLAPKHINWIRTQDPLGSISLEDYAKRGYQLGADGMIEKMPPRKSNRAEGVLNQGSDFAGDQDKEEAHTSPQQVSESLTAGPSGSSNAFDRPVNLNAGSNTTLQGIPEHTSTSIYGQGPATNSGQMGSSSRKQPPDPEMSQQVNLSSREMIDLTRSPSPEEIIDLTDSPTG